MTKATEHACIGEETGNSLQYSYLENPRDRGAWWAAVYGVAQSQIRVKQLSSSSSSNGTMMVVIIHLPKLIDCTTPRVYCNINYG